MASCKPRYTVKDFKKDKNIPKRKANDCSTESEFSKCKITEEYVAQFNNEDRLISRLYRQVVDAIMSKNKLCESTVNNAIDDMKREISQGHRKGFRKFPGIDFCQPENCCGYLRRYAVCHTGLVKQIMWNFFHQKSDFARLGKYLITKQKHLKVVSLGGGPGNDLVGFCCAMQEIANSVTQLDLYIVDICKGWINVFTTILRQAALIKFGSFSDCLEDIKKINTGFMEADLTADGIFEDERLSSTLSAADLILMVKLVSFLPNTEAGPLIENVVKLMKENAILVFIDTPYDSDFFREINNLYLLYHDYIKYELSFNPAKLQSPSIDSTKAHVGIYIKLDEDSSSSDES